MNLLKNILLNPDLFFNNKSNEKIDLKLPFFIVLLNSLIAIIPAIFIIDKLKESMPSEASSYMLPGMIIGMIAGVIVGVATWIIMSAIFYIISSLFNAEGTFKKTVEFVGYGFIPKIFASIIGLIILYIILPNMDISTNLQMNEQNLQQIAGNTPLMWLYQITGFITAIWSASIWIFGIAHARKISVKNSFLTVIVPVGLGIIYSIYKLISGII